MVDIIKCPYYKNINNTISFDDYITHKTFYKRDRHLLDTSEDFHISGLGTSISSTEDFRSSSTNSDSSLINISSKGDFISSNIYFTKNNNNFFYKKMNLENVCDWNNNITLVTRPKVSITRTLIKNKTPHTFPKLNNDCSSKNITQNKIIKLSKYGRSLSYN